MTDEQAQKKAAPMDKTGQPQQAQDKYTPNGLNYISLIQNFWRSDQQNEFNGNETRLYFYLIHVANGLYWQNPFNCSYRQLALKTGISTSLLPDYLKRLDNAGLIKIIPGKRGYSKLPGSTTQIFIKENIEYDTHNGGENIEYDTHIGENIIYDTHNDGVSIEKQAKTDTHTIIINKTNKRESKKFAPPSHQLIVDLFNRIYKEKNKTEKPAPQIDLFINYYSGKNWRNGSRVKITNHNLEVNIRNWIGRDEIQFNRRPQATQSDKPTAADSANTFRSAKPY